MMILPHRNQTPDPCDHADSLESNAEYKEKFDSLKQKIHDNKEHGYIYNHNGAGIDETPIVGEVGEAGISFDVQTPIDGFMHSHYDDLLSVFSPDDIYAMANLYKTNRMTNVSTFTAGVVTSKGTQYILMIDDITKYFDFATNLVNNNTLDLFSEMYENFYKITPNNSNNANEKAFLQFLDQSNSGLKLFKGNGSFNDWKPKKLDNNGNVVNAPCD